MGLAARVDRMDDGHASMRASAPQHVWPADTMAFDPIIGISAQTPVAGVAAQVDLARWSHRSIDDLLGTSLQLPGRRAPSSHLHVGRFLDTSQ
eukprot:6308390-Pyramimonas_sp.AAC.2